MIQGAAITRIEHCILEDNCQSIVGTCARQIRLKDKEFNSYIDLLHPILLILVFFQVLFQFPIMFVLFLLFKVIKKIISSLIL